MEPSLRDGDVLSVRRYGPDSRPPRRGEVVIVQDPDRADRWLVKRVFAVGGERLLVGPGAVRRRPARASPLERPPTGAERFLEEIVVLPGHVFLLSDAPQVGRDSRSFGALPLTSVLGIAGAPGSDRRTTKRRRSRPVT
jgi:signal peptidase I